jgi:hypothetical protein
MTTITPTQKYNQVKNRTNKTYGLLSNEMTAVMQRDKQIAVGELLVLGRKGIANLTMLYNWWMIYAFKNYLIKDNRWILPNETIDALLADDYIKFGASSGVPFALQTYLRMIGQHLSYDQHLNLSPEHINYLSSQENILLREREKYKMNNM